MGNQIIVATMGFGVSAILALGLLTGSTNANARSPHIITLGSPVFHQDIKKLRRLRAKKSRRYVRRNSTFSPGPLRVFKGATLTRRATHFVAPRRCTFKWVHSSGGGYRKIVCKRGYRSRFPANRPWAYRTFRKAANWDQSRAWAGRIPLHNLYRGDLERTDHGRQIQGNPHRYLDDPVRYEQSRQFGQKIYFPRADW